MIVVSRGGRHLPLKRKTNIKAEIKEAYNDCNALILSVSVGILYALIYLRAAYLVALAD